MVAKKIATKKIAIMRIYISTPVNARPEKTFAEKYAAASKRVEEIKCELRTRGYEDAEFVSFADVAPLGECTEAQAMGRCVQAVMESDMCLVDDSNEEGFANSIGCRIEAFVTYHYLGNRVLYLSEYKNEH